MKNIVLTIAVGENYERMAELTHPSLREYADKIGADFKVVTENHCSTPHWEKLHHIYQLLNTYERVLYFDTDILIREDCPNLFDVVPEEALGVFDEAKWTGGRLNSIRDACLAAKETLSSWDGRYFNTGVMVVPRHWRHVFKHPGDETFNFYEQGYLNLAIAKTVNVSGNELRIQELDYKFNRMTCMDKFTGEERFASYVIHYAGYPSLDMVMGLIRCDIEKWGKDSPEFSYCRHILVDVQGGLGDQICAEPVIRFLRERIYPEDEVVVKTHWPDLFQHLPVSVYHHDDCMLKPDTPYYRTLTLPGPDTLTWNVVSHLLSHSVDYISIAVLKRILPNWDKEVRLTYSMEDLAEVLDVVGLTKLDDLVLVHSGRHWASKTFPIEWWQKVIDDLAENFKICLIGKDEKTRGCVNIEVGDGVIDTRNLLTLRQLIALIGCASVVVSNDSAPIHIAGFSDIGIVLIPTCKHPNHLLPWRKGSQSYKTCALYKKLMVDEYESAPTTLYGSSADYVPGDWNEYLPEVGQVVDAVFKLRNE